MIKLFLVTVFAMILLACDGSSIGEDKAPDNPLAGSVESDDMSFEKPSAASGWSDKLSTTRENGFSDAVPGSSQSELTELSKGDKVNPLEDHALNARDPKARIEALQELVKQNKAAALPVVEAVLEDNDDEVRRETLLLIYKNQMAVPSSMLNEIALNDSNDKVRGMAAINIVDRGTPEEARDYLLQALNDSNADIRRDAKIHLDKLDRQKRLYSQTN